MDTGKVPLLQSEDVEKLLPQKKPFVLVDTLWQHDTSCCEASFTVPEKHVMVHGAALSHGGILEHMAQTAALHLGYQGRKNATSADFSPQKGYIAGVKKFAVFARPQVSESIISTLEIVDAVSGIMNIRVTTRLEGKIIAEGELKTVLADS